MLKSVDERESERTDEEEGGEEIICASALRNNDPDMYTYQHQNESLPTLSDIVPKQLFNHN
jgi:hypothetical protein